MKRFHIALLTSLILWGTGLTAIAQPLPSEGDWKKTTINAKTSPDTTEPVIELTGDINLKGTITISNGYTLTIKSSEDRLIQKPLGTSGTMFSVDTGGTLIISGENGAEITIDGGADFKWSDYTLESSLELKNVVAITNDGTLSLSNAIIQNIYYKSRYKGAIYVTSKTGTTSLDHCIIKWCKAPTGCAIMINNPDKDKVGYTSEGCKVSLTDCCIEECISGGSTEVNNGGAIRTLGSCISNLYLTRVTFQRNMTTRTAGEFNNTLEQDGNGGALFWNARGNEDTKCVINECLFEYNKSEDNGGAIKSQGTIEFAGKQTIIQHNEAPNGAGLYIEGYSGSNVTGKRTITIDLDQNVLIQNNTAPSYSDSDPGKGAGVHFYFGEEMKLDRGSTIIININGAIIRNNQTSGTGGLGGGVYFENTSPASKNYTFEINLNHGEITNNFAGEKGGGIYVYKEKVVSKEIEGKNISISGNASYSGAGIYIHEGNLDMANGIITGNTVSGGGNGGGIYIENGDFTIDAGEVSSNTLESGQGAGVYIVGSDGKGNFTMNGGEIKGNITTGNNGGGVYIDGGNFTLNQGTITGNESVDGGGVYLNNGNFSLVMGQISDNTVSGNGGGVYLVGEDCVYRLKNGSITQNSAQNGGGVYLANGSFILAETIADVGSISRNTASATGGGVYIAGSGGFTMNGGTVELNTTTSGNGGGIFLNGGNFTMNNGKITDNSSAAQGGGVYLYGGAFLMENGNIADNSSASVGGGVCILNGGGFTMNSGSITGNGRKDDAAVTTNGGGVYLDGGSLRVTKGNISSNESTSNGGGLYILNGTVEMGAGEILGNNCGQYGGGVYVYNSSGSGKDVIFSGGTLKGNSAKYGGGVCVNGQIDLEIGNVEIAENMAVNGGGVCLMNNAYMAFGKGQIKNNTAQKKNSTAYPTGYGEVVKIDQIEGFGGGIYLDSSTQLVFSYAAELGLFGNLADTGGDEIFANGDNTKVDLPDVSNMALEGYPGASNLKWIEDYPTDDPNYDKGTKLKGNAWDSDMTNLRYRETISRNETVYNLSGATIGNTKYICFALGYEVAYITITRSGLKNGESAIYHLRKNEDNDFKVILTGNSDGTDVTKKIAVTAGDWTVTETSWSWAYEGEKTIIRAVPDPDPVENPETGRKEDRPFAFNLSRAVSLPMNHEDVEINIMGN